MIKHGSSSSRSLTIVKTGILVLVRVLEIHVVIAAAILISITTRIASIIIILITILTGSMQ